MSTAPQAAAAPAAPTELPLNNQENTESTEVEAVEGQEATDASKDSTAKPAPAAKVKEQKNIEKRLKKLKLKVDNKEFEEEIDLDDDEALIRNLQMAKMGQKRAQEKADLEKELSKFFGELQKNPLDLLAREMGMNVDQVIQKYIEEQVENAKKGPEQLEKEKLQAELKRIHAERDHERQENKQKELSRLQQQEFERYDMLMEQALTKSDIPKTPYVVKKIADYMLVALQNGYDVAPEDVVPLVREEMHNDLGEMFQSMPEEVIEKLLGDQVLNKLRKRRVAKAQDAAKAVSKPNILETGKNSKTESEKPKDKKSFKEFFGV